MQSPFRMAVLIAALVSSLPAQQVVRYGEGCRHGVTRCQSKNASDPVTWRSIATNNQIFLRIDVARSVTLSGFALRMRSRGGVQRLQADLFAADGNRRPAGLLRRGKDISAYPAPHWGRTYFAPLAVRGGTTLYLSVRNAAPGVDLGSLRGGANAQWYRRPFGGSLVEPTQRPWQIRLICGGATPNMRSVTPPRINTTWIVRTDNFPAGQTAVLGVGFNRSRFGDGKLLPFDLRPFGAPFCDVLNSVALVLPTRGNEGRIVIPNWPALRGTKIYCQFYIRAPGANSVEQLRVPSHSTFNSNHWNTSI